MNDPTTPDTEPDLVVEVFADITCPFTHVGLKRVVEHVEEMRRPAIVLVRAWPLEWVNGTPLKIEAVAEKAEILGEQLEVEDFSGLDQTHWPSTTLPALDLAAAAYEVDAHTGLEVSMELRAALFEQGLDISDPVVLDRIGDAHGGLRAGPRSRDAVQADYDDGKQRGVRGSPHFWVETDEFFCPALDLGHDDEGHLTAHFDPVGLAAFFARIDG